MVTSIFGLPVKDIFNKSNDFKRDIRLGVFLLLLLLPAFTTTAQHAQAVESIANAERAFAQISVDKNTRAAFLETFTDSTIAFNGGKPSFGRPGWEKQDPDNNYLFWWPVYADVAASGDFGYTTGPAVFGPDRSTREAKAGFYYASVWKKNSSGQWKVLADLGSSAYKLEENLTTLGTTGKPSGKEKKSNTPWSTIVDMDVKYDLLINDKKASYDASYFSGEGRIHRRGTGPVISKASIEQFSEKQKFYSEFVGGQMASSKDMAFTYGTVKVTLIRDGKEVVVPACYMRVWKNEDGTWKIVLDVIG
jgi:ketosteroid isomerase-like protein